LRTLNGLENLSKEPVVFHEKKEPERPQDLTSSQDGFVTKSEKKMSVKDVSRISESETIKESRNHALFYTNLRIVIMALNGKRDSKSIAFLKKFLIENGDDVSKEYLDFAKRLIGCLDKSNWQEEIKEFKTISRDGKEVSLDSEDRMAKMLGVGGICFWPTVNAITPLMTLGYKDHAKLMLDEGKEMHKSFSAPETEGDKKSFSTRERYLEVYRKAIYENFIPGMFVSKSALNEKSFCIGESDCHEKKSLQDLLNDSKVVVVVRGEYYCKPCKKELKALDNDRSWQVGGEAQLVIISEKKADDPERELQKDVKNKFYESNHAANPNSKLTDAFSTPSVPKIYIIAQNGQLIAVLPELPPDKLIERLKKINELISSGQVELGTR